MRTLRRTFLMVAFTIAAGLASSAAMAQTEVKLTASDAANSDEFGQSVSISGDYAIVGGPLDDDDGSSSGSAYIFKRDGTSWSQQDKLTASDASSSDLFGFSVSIDGDYATVGGAPFDDGSGSGSAYIFNRSGTTWTEQAKLTASDAADNDFFGYSVSISGDYVIVGAYGAAHGGIGGGGAYIFTRSGTSWAQQATLTASDAHGGNRFGHSVSIDGDNAIVGAYRDDDDAGSAYMFTRSGTSWSQHAKLTASDAVTNDFFGFSVSISGDNAIVGANGNDDDGSNSGSAYVYADVSPEVKLVILDGFGMRGERLQVPISLENDGSVPLKGLQFDVLLDSMFTFVGIVDSLGGQGFSVSAEADTGVVTVVVYTLSEDILSKSTTIGALLYDVKPVQGSKVRGEPTPIVKISPRSTVAVDTLLNLVDISNGQGSFEIGIRGDVNHDGSITIVDVISSVLTILGKIAAPNNASFAFARLDGDNDGKITVVDVVSQINRILGRPIDQPLPRVAYSHVTVDLGHPVTSGEGIAIPLSVVTGTPVSGLQLSYSFDPSHMAIGTPVLTAASSDVSIAWHIEAGTLNVIAYSVEGKAITLGPESVLIPVTVPEGMSPEITLTNAVLSDLYGNIVPVLLGQTRVSVTAAPTAFSMAVARPNPFNPSTTIAYEVPEQTHVTLTIYNLLGQEVVRLMDQVQAAGRYEAVWHGTNSRGAGVASGVYLYRIVSGSGYTETKRMTLLK